MKRIIILFSLCMLVSIMIIISTRRPFSSSKKETLHTPTPTPLDKKDAPLSTSLFIPYWNVDKNETTFTPPFISSLKMIKTSRIIYFGITANSHGVDPDLIRPDSTQTRQIGVDTTESGYKNLIHIPPDQKDALLVFHLSNTTILETMLSDDKLFQNVTKEVTRIAHKYNYHGILLDLEIQSLPTDKTVEQITSFVQRFSNQLKLTKLTFAMTLFGDQFYRHRPYDLEALQKSVDHFYIMAYDLHKTKGESGPNFPLKKGSTSDYDLLQAIDQFTTILSPEQITVVFGMYGYDWIVDEKKRTIKKAKSLTLAHIKKNFLGKCSWKKCVIRRDALSEETEINYVEPPLTYHIVWFEDEQSVDKKIQALLKKGIVHYAFWAWGYY